MIYQGVFRRGRLDWAQAASIERGQDTSKASPSRIEEPNQPKLIYASLVEEHKI
jgi:hypothetical protein